MTRAAVILCVILCAILLAGCEVNPGAAARGAARIALFKQCMELAAKMPRQADDDVSNIVDSCGQQSYYMSNYIK